MNELKEQPQKQTDSIYVDFWFVDGRLFTQEIYMKNAEWVEELLKWYRDKKSKPTWTYNYPPVKQISLFQKSHIMSIEIRGYIELSRIKYKWYEKLFDKLLTSLIFLKMKGDFKWLKR